MAARLPRTIARTVATMSVAAVCVVGMGACGSGSGSDQATQLCGPVKREAFDSRSLQHILPTAPTPAYLTDPPTSGPHQPSPPIHGERTTSIPKPVQVGILEGGNVLLQYRDLPSSQLQALRALAGTKVVVAPNPDLKAGQVVATAWLYKQTCTAVDASALRSFVHQHANHGPDYHATG